jgi:hypothetical protein
MGYVFVMELALMASWPDGGPKPGTPEAPAA